MTATQTDDQTTKEDSPEEKEVKKQRILSALKPAIKSEVLNFLKTRRAAFHQASTPTLPIIEQRVRAFVVTLLDENQYDWFRYSGVSGIKLFALLGEVLLELETEGTIATVLDRSSYTSGLEYVFIMSGKN